MKKRIWWIIIIIFLILAAAALFYFYSANSGVCPINATISVSGECVIPSSQTNTNLVPDFAVRFAFLKRYFGIGEF